MNTPQTPEQLKVKEAIEQGNRLIGEFMGYKYSKSGRTVRKGDCYTSPYRLKDIQFHSSFDQLMPVAKKILELRPLSGKAMSHINQMERLVSALMIADMDQIYSACLQFIQWYNSQKQTNL